MGSLNAAGIPVVSKQQLSHRSYGRNLAVTLNQGNHSQDSVRQPVVEGVPAYARASGDFGTQSTPATESFLHLTRFVKHAESENDTTVARYLGQIAATTGLVPEDAQQHEGHRGNRVAVQQSIDDLLLARKRNDSVRPGGEI